jgi:hypothetical protein
MAIVDFPLYHATSSIFEDSIKLLGLGGYNPVKELKAIEFLAILEEMGDRELAKNKLWNKLEFQDTINKMTTQTITDGGFNYQHGEVYLTPRIHTAVGYSRNKYGSEIISKIFETLDLFTSLDVKIDSKMLADFQNLISLKELTAIPVIYEINNLPIEYLSMGESGQDLEKHINLVIENISKFGKIITPRNFRLKKTIPFDMLMKIS